MIKQNLAKFFALSSEQKHVKVIALGIESFTTSVGDTLLNSVAPDTEELLAKG